MGHRWHYSRGTALLNNNCLMKTQECYPKLNESEAWHQMGKYGSVVGKSNHQILWHMSHEIILDVYCTSFHMKHPLNKGDVFGIVYNTLKHTTSQRRPATQPWAPLIQSELSMWATSLFFSGFKKKFSFNTSAPMQHCQRLWDWERTASYQPAPDQQSLSYPSWKYTGLPVTGLAHGALAAGRQHEHDEYVYLFTPI